MLKFPVAVKYNNIKRKYKIQMYLDVIIKNNIAFFNFIFFFIHQLSKITKLNVSFFQ